MIRRTKVKVWVPSLPPTISWVPSKSNPADAPSRLHEYNNPMTMQAEAWATFLVASKAKYGPCGHGVAGVRRIIAGGEGGVECREGARTLADPRICSCGYYCACEVGKGRTTIKPLFMQ